MLRLHHDRAERALYGASVVDAYMDLHNISVRVRQRLPHCAGAKHSRVVYRLLGIVDRLSGA